MSASGCKSLGVLERSSSLEQFGSFLLQWQFNYGVYPSLGSRQFLAEISRRVVGERVEKPERKAIFVIHLCLMLMNFNFLQEVIGFRNVKNVPTSPIYYMLPVKRHFRPIWPGLLLSCCQVIKELLKGGTRFSASLPLLIWRYEVECHLSFSSELSCFFIDTNCHFDTHYHTSDRKSVV